jgi:uncharacterized membrane protein
MNGVLLLIAFIVVIYFLVTILNRNAEQQKLLESLHDKIKQLRGEISDLSSKVKDGKTVAKAEESIEIPKPIEEKKKEQVLPTRVAETLQPVITTEEELPPVVVSPASNKEKKKADIDFEKFIGENLANKIGIAVLVLGISFFVKYAIDKDWINEFGRVAIGLASGGILIGFAHYLRNSYRAFSSVLVGGGLAVFYFTIGFAFHQYHLIGQTTAFIIMVLISALGVFLSVFYNRQELALLAAIGGFITPFLVSTGQENYIALFTYLCILNAGLMALSWFKRWPSINITGLFFTILIYGGWIIKHAIHEEESGMPYRDALMFATIFYLLFVAMNILNTLRLKNKFTAFDFLILLGVNFLYYAGGMVLIGYWKADNYDGWFTAALGVFNLILSIIFYRQKSVDRNFVLLLLGLSLCFFSLVAPILFDANYVVLCWAGQSVIMNWLYRRSGIGLLKISSLILCLLMILGLILTWMDVYWNDPEAMPVIFNKGFITTIVAAIAFFLLHLFAKEERNSGKMSPLHNELLAAGIIIAYCAGFWEIRHQFNSRFPDSPVYTIYWQAWTCVATIIILKVFKLWESQRSLKYILTAICFGFYLLLIGQTNEASLALLTGGSGLLFLMHWIASGLLIWLLYDLGRFITTDSAKVTVQNRRTFAWVIAAAGIIVLSAELYQVIMWTQYDKVDWAWWQNLYYKAGLTILWAVCSFALMWIGMKRGFKTARIISLTLFTITLVKLFAFDIRNIPPGGKIAAFICLGVLLLAVSFMYQRLKKIIIDNDAGKSTV